MSKVTLREIAQSLGVSTSLVSGVLNNRPNVWASEETRQRILQEAIVRGYRPHAAARSLRSGKTHNVLLAYQPVTTIPIDAIATGLAQAGYQLQAAVFANTEGLRKTIHMASSTRMCDALILWGDEEIVEPAAEDIAALRMPVVLKGRYESTHPEWYQVDFDHERMMATAVEHLRTLGHQRIGYMGYRLERQFARVLLQGYLEAMHSLIGRDVPSVYYEHTVTEPEDAVQIVQRWFALPENERPTAAVIGAGNNAWYGIERALFSRGMFIGEEPGDFAVCGQSYEGLVLSFGKAYAFKELALNTVASAMVERLLMPLLSGQCPDTSIIRILPPFQQVETHGYRCYMQGGRH